jgi:hypothetical protein
MQKGIGKLPPKGHHSKYFERVNPIQRESKFTDDVSIHKNLWHKVITLKEFRGIPFSHKNPQNLISRNQTQSQGSVGHLVGNGKVVAKSH